MAFSVSNIVLSQLVGSLLQGADNTIEKMIFEKIESYGKDVISDLIRATPLGAGLSAAQRYKNFIGMNDREFKQSRDQWLNSLTAPESVSTGSGGGGTGSRLLEKIRKSFEDFATKDGSGRPFEKGNWKWSKSRQEWLDDWRHDWRSQPRDTMGRWTEGRLNYIYVARGKASKKVRSARRRAARRRVKWNPNTGNYE